MVASVDLPIAEEMFAAGGVRGKWFAFLLLLLLFFWWGLPLTLHLSS